VDGGDRRLARAVIESSDPDRTVVHMRPLPPGEVWSPSRARKYEQCPRAWWLSYRSGTEGTPPPVHWRRGSVAHAGLQAVYETVAQLQRLPWPGITCEVFYPIAEHAVEVAWREHEMPDDADMRDTLLEQLRIVLASQPMPQPASILGVELELSGVIAHQGGSVPVRGLADVAFRLAEDWVHVRDWKTYSQIPSEEELRRDLQLGTYALLAARRFPWARRITASIFSVPKAFERSVTFQRYELDAVAARLADIAHAANADEVCAPQPSEWCSTCSHRALCPIFAPNVAIGPATDATELANMRAAVESLDGF
jgi:RecB family exonuclease